MCFPPALFITDSGQVLWEVHEDSSINWCKAVLNTKGCIAAFSFRNVKAGQSNPISVNELLD